MAKKPQSKPEAGSQPAPETAEPAVNAATSPATEGAEPSQVSPEIFATVQGVEVPPGDLAADLAEPARIASAPEGDLPSPEPVSLGVSPVRVTLIVPAIIDGRRREIGETVEVDEVIAAQLAGAKAI